MKNHNILEKEGNIVDALKNGDYNYIILFESAFNPIENILSTFPENSEKEDNESFRKVLFKNKSPFRIGKIRVEAYYLKNILVKNKKYIFDKEKFTTIIKDLCKEHKQSMFLLPMSFATNSFRKEIYEILETNVHDTKVTILN